MPVDSQHPQYQSRTAQWSRIRDVLAASDAVKQNAGKYLRRPATLNGFDFAEYARSATFFAASARTLDGLCGAIL